MFYYFCFAVLIVASSNGQAANSQSPIPKNSFRPSQTCPKRDGYFKHTGSCDTYIECQDFKATTQSCPDGLNYNSNAKWPEYPCGYPMDVPCLNHDTSQPARPTAECPNQYGFYPSLKATPDRCGYYIMCVAGRAIEMACPFGLAFNDATGQCDWPEQVASCNFDELFGFKCPAPPLSADGHPLDIILNFKYEGECFYFFSCDKGRARLLSCDYGLAFDPVSAHCVNADLVQCQIQPMRQNQPIVLGSS